MNAHVVHVYMLPVLWNIVQLCVLKYKVGMYGMMVFFFCYWDHSFPANMNDLNTILSELEQISEFYQFGLQLGLQPSRLDRVEENNFKVKSRMKDVVKTWLNRDYMVDRYGPPTWELLSKAVRRLNPVLSASIKKKYCSQ